MHLAVLKYGKKRCTMCDVLTELVTVTVTVTNLFVGSELVHESEIGFGVRVVVLICLSGRLIRQHIRVTCTRAQPFQYSLW